MADPLSITASIITIVHLSKKILDYLFDIKNAPKERTQFYGELSNLNTLLLYLRDRIDKTAPGDPWFKAACGLQVDEALGQFHSALESLISSLGGAHDIKKSRGLKSVKWPFEKKEVVTLLAKIERLKSLISLALTTGTAAAVQGIAETQALQEDRMKEAKRLQIADWVSPLNARAITREILKQREEGTGAWLLQSPEFQDWVSQKQRFLWLYGPRKNCPVNHVDFRTLTYNRSGCGEDDPGVHNRRRARVTLRQNKHNSAECFLQAQRPTRTDPRELRRQLPQAASTTTPFELRGRGAI